MEVTSCLSLRMPLAPRWNGLKSLIPHNTSIQGLEVSKLLGHISDCSQLPHYTTTNKHFLYTETQLSKGHYNDNEREVLIDGKGTKLRIRYASCKGVLKCPEIGCTFAASRNAKKCSTHPAANLAPSGPCPVYVVYVYPPDCDKNNERWIGGLTKDKVANSTQTNLHNHPLPMPHKVPSVVQEAIKTAVESNPALTPSQINLGKFQPQYCYDSNLLYHNIAYFATVFRHWYWLYAYGSVLSCTS